jgi:type 1 glutamine amidotransferase
MRKQIKSILLPLGIFLIAYTGYALIPSDRVKHIVLIAGEKSHGPGEHEYIKTVQLLKTMLDHSNVSNIESKIVLHGWPQDETILDKADLILTVSDGQDADFGAPVPFMTRERMGVMEKQMKRGCGFATLHFSTFAPDSLGEKVLDWGGGYFDWQGDDGKRNWYSSIKILDTIVTLATPSHPAGNGVHPFKIKEEFYYNIRFKKDDNRLTPLLEVASLQGRKENGNVVAWAVQRKDGGHGFCTTMGHYYTNWQNTEFRKFMLNGIVWAAGTKVPGQGIESKFYTDEQVSQHLSKSPKSQKLTQ